MAHFIAESYPHKLTTSANELTIKEQNEDKRNVPPGKDQAGQKDERE